MILELMGACFYCYFSLFLKRLFVIAIVFKIRSHTQHVA